MGYYFISIKNLDKNLEDSVTSFFKYLIGNDILISYDSIYSVIFKQEDICDIKEALSSMTNDFIDVVIYLSKSYELKERLDEDLFIINDKLDKFFMFNSNLYEEKEFVKELIMNNKLQSLDKIVLGSYEKDLYTKEILKKYIENNMNTSKTADVLYVHRNTLINKLDRFKESTKYDPKIFIDAFIIYHIL